VYFYRRIKLKKGTSVYQALSDKVLGMVYICLKVGLSNVRYLHVLRQIDIR